MSPAEQVAYQRGLQEGLVQGRESAQKEAQHQLRALVEQEALVAGRATAQQMDSLLQTFQSEFEGMQQGLAEKTLDLAIAIAQTIVAREIESDRSVILPVIRDCIEPLGKAALDLKVTLHPTDLAAVEDAIEQAQIPGFDYLISDSSIQPGGCVLESHQGLIDGQLQTRWQRTLASIGKDE